MEQLISQPTSRPMEQETVTFRCTFVGTTFCGGKKTFRVFVDAPKDIDRAKLRDFAGDLIDFPTLSSAQFRARRIRPTPYREPTEA